MRLVEARNPAYQKAGLPTRPGRRGAPRLVQLPVSYLRKPDVAGYGGRTGCGFFLLSGAHPLEDGCSFLVVEHHVDFEVDQIAPFSYPPVDGCWII